MNYINDCLIVKNIKEQYNKLLNEDIIEYQNTIIKKQHKAINELKKKCDLHANIINDFIKKRIIIREDNLKLKNEIKELENIILAFTAKEEEAEQNIIVEAEQNVIVEAEQNVIVEAEQNVIVEYNTPREIHAQALEKRLNKKKIKKRRKKFIIK